MSTQCNAKAKHSQEPCKLPATPGRERCRFHGGKTRMGPGSGTFTTGKFSKFLPSRMAADFDAAMGDPELVSLRKEIATVDARIIDLYKRVDKGEAGTIWEELHEGWASLERAQARAEAGAYQAAFDHVKRIVAKGYSDTAAWAEVCKQIDLRRKLVDSEQRRMTLAHESLNSDRAMMMMARMVGIIQKHVTDRGILGAIAADMQAELLMRKRDDIYEQVRIGPDAAD
jgi:hypothetical protein